MLDQFSPLLLFFPSFYFKENGDREGREGREG
jgi:hypothetical protein